eukprot:TRINITY_DN104863_c0_g1_i1.p1 TRINITY_DN104863_c0_g1~~TRINITY_DN104863_c0_g1_i1.p1  ORF type:complete len:307 (-),score=66.23 TRINITY_DN104863_c0_g1_i1:38-895(-)
MSTGNPFGLSEISHFGQMRSVGGKAGGFINKKFFHPSSLRNQEKLWKAITADAMEKRRQDDMEKRRDEERKVEELRKQMYLSGQASSSDAIFTSAGASDAGAERGTAEQQRAYKETKRRKQMLMVSKVAAAGTEDDAILLETEGAKEELCTDDGEAARPGDSRTVDLRDLRQMIKSKYPENVLVRGHSQIWGSWFERQEQRWGFACCQMTDSKVTCPHAPSEVEEADKKTRTRGERRGKKRKGEDGAVETRAAALTCDTKAETSSPASKDHSVEKPVPAIELIPD